MKLDTSEKKKSQFKCCICEKCHSSMKLLSPLNVFYLRIKFFIPEPPILFANKIKDKKSMICFMLENNKIRMAHRGHLTLTLGVFGKVSSVLFNAYCLLSSINRTECNYNDATYGFAG